MMRDASTTSIRTGGSRVGWLFAASAAGLVAGCGGYASSGATPAAPAPHLVVTTRATSLGQVLTDPTGRTLYYYVADGDNRSTCEGQCAVNWPPLAAAERIAPTSAVTLPGALGTLRRSDGTFQVAYNDRPLYTYAGDAKPGDTLGEGKGSVWYVATPALADPDAAATPSTPAASPIIAATPGFNDHDADNAGGASDGDGNG